MEHHKISKLLNDSTVSKFAKRKWIEVNGLLNGKYSVHKNLRFKTPMLRSNLCDYSDAYVVVKRRITVASTSNGKTRNKEASL